MEESTSRPPSADPRLGERNSFDPRVWLLALGTFAVGTDSATWRYVPPSCAVYDAGVLQNGGFPDAGNDALPFVPIESGVDP